METKKNPSADVTKKSGYFFSIGLFISTALAVMAFEWQQKDAFIDLQAHHDNPGEPLLNIPVTRDPLPPAPVPVKINPVITEVPDDAAEDSTFTFDPHIADSLIQIPRLIEEPAPEDGGNDVVTIAEVAASPQGGFEAFYKYVSEHFKYPAQARRMGIEGKVYVEFIINKDGSNRRRESDKGDWWRLRRRSCSCNHVVSKLDTSAPTWQTSKTALHVADHS